MRGVTKLHHPKLFEAVAEQLRAAIVSGELRPGDKLPETELAQQFGVSRGPIREALRELSREGMVVDLARRGTLVSTVTLGDLIEVYDVREALETFATSLVIARATTSDLSRLRALSGVMQRAWRSRSIPHAKRITADLDFHRAIHQIAGNARMLVLFDQLATQTSLLLRSAMETNPTLQLSPPDEVHEGILSAILAGDTIGAREAVSGHYRHTRERLFTFFEEQSPELAARGAETPDPARLDSTAMATARGGQRSRAARDR